MPAYSITYKPSAAKAFRKIHPSDRRRIKDAIENLAQNPRTEGYVLLTGGAGECRIRVGQYRVVYDIEDDELAVLVLRVGYRCEIYR